MRITALHTDLVEVPLPRPITTSIHDMRSVGCVLVTIDTDAGVSGEGFAFTLNATRLGAVDELVRGFASHVTGKSPYETEGIWHEIFDAVNPTGQRGLTIAALSAIDTGCWDAAARAVDLPLAKMFGAARDSVPTYASSGLWLSATIDELVAEATAFVDAGFVGVKMRLGRPDDVERVAAVRDAIGYDVDLYGDLNQALRPKEAIRLGRRLEEFQLAWLEEPVASHALVGHAEVRRALDTPIASGETEYTRYAMADMLAAGSVDVLMPDHQRIGGYSEMRKTAAIASAYRIPISTHFFTEYSLSLAASEQGCISVEHIDWFAPLFREAMELRNGELVVPDRPGTGFRFDRDRVESFRLG